MLISFQGFGDFFQGVGGIFPGFDVFFSTSLFFPEVLTDLFRVLVVFPGVG